MNIIFLKLGGSLITDKAKSYTAKPEIISQLFAEIKEVVTAHPDTRFVIGHGAGSFAHQSAKQYNTVNGFSNETGKFGASYVHFDALKLHQIVLEQAMNHELPVFSLQPASFILSENKMLKECNASVILELLKKNMIPLVHGDVIVDSEIGATIYSTDKIFAAVIQKIIQQDSSTSIQIIHAGNFNGVLDENNNVIAKISVQNFDSLKNNIGGSDHVDVTGGMMAKVAESVELAKQGIESVIINGNIKGNILKTIAGERIGTQIVAS